MTLDRVRSTIRSTEISSASADSDNMGEIQESASRMRRARDSNDASASTQRATVGEDTNGGDVAPLDMKMSGSDALSAAVEPMIDTLVSETRAKAQDKGLPFDEAAFRTKVSRNIARYGAAIDHVANGSPATVSDVARLVNDVESVIGRRDLTAYDGTVLRGLAFMGVGLSENSDSNGRMGGGIAINTSFDGDTASLRTIAIEELGERFFQTTFGTTSNGDFGSQTLSNVTGAAATREINADDTVRAEVDGVAVVGEASTSSEFAQNSSFRQMQRADGYFEDFPANGVLSAEEIKVAFRTPISSYDPTAPSTRLQPRSGVLSASTEKDIENFVQTFGQLNPDTGYQVVDMAQLQEGFKAGYFGTKQVGAREFLTMEKSPTGSAAAEGLVVSTEGASTVAQALPAADVRQIAQEDGAVGLIAYVSAGMGTGLTNTEILDIAETFATGGTFDVSPRFANSVINVSAAAFSEVALGNASGGSAKVLQNALKGQLGLLDSASNFGKWEEKLFVGTEDGATPGTEFLRSFLSLARSEAVKLGGGDEVDALDAGTYVPWASLRESAQLPTRLNDNAVDVPVGPPGAIRRSESTYNADGTLNTDALDFRSGEILSGTTRVTDPASPQNGWLALPTAMSEPQPELGLKAVMVDKSPDPGVLEQKRGEEVKVVDYVTSGPGADAINGLISQGFQMEFIEVTGSSEAVKTVETLSPYVDASVGSFKYQYNADGTLVEADPLRRMAQYNQDTTFEVSSEPVGDGTNFDGSGPTELVGDIATDFLKSGVLNDREAMRSMLNELGLSDADIETFAARVSAEAENLDVLAPRSTSVQDIVIDTFADVFTAGVSGLLQQVLPADKNAVLDFARGELTAAGRSTGQVDKIGDKLGEVDIDAGELAMTLGFMALDVAGLAPLTKAARAAGKAADAGVSFRTAFRQTADATLDTPTGTFVPTNPTRGVDDVAGGVDDAVGGVDDAPSGTPRDGEIQPAGPRVPSSGSGGDLTILNQPIKRGFYEGEQPASVLAKADARNFLVNMAPEGTSFDAAYDSGQVIPVSLADEPSQAEFLTDLVDSGSSVNNFRPSDPDKFGVMRLRGGSGSPETPLEARVSDAIDSGSGISRADQAAVNRSAEPTYYNGDAAAQVARTDLTYTRTADEMAEIKGYATLSRSTYKPKTLGEIVDTVNGKYEVLAAPGSIFDVASGRTTPPNTFVYAKVGDPTEQVVAFRGTQDVSDVGQDISGYLSGPTTLQKEQLDFTEAVVENADAATEVSVTGHSLGGRTGTLAAVTAGVRAFVFNAAGQTIDTVKEAMRRTGAVQQGAQISRSDAVEFVEDTSRLGSNVVNINTENDIVTTLQTSATPSYQVGSVYNIPGPKGKMGVTAHSMASVEAGLQSATQGGPGNTASGSANIVSSAAIADPETGFGAFSA